jgi:guanosine-3',5'-bis(diphosphate) 3'-pyrophosphohydrolase
MKTPKLHQAILFAKNAHKNQKRADGSAYFTHCRKVMQLVSQVTKDEDTICAAVLHDVIEDCHVTHADIEMKFGLHVANIVEELSKNYTQPKNITMKEAIIIKLADRLHNVSDMNVWDFAKQKAYIKNTKRLMEELK